MLVFFLAACGGSDDAAPESAVSTAPPDAPALRFITTSADVTAEENRYVITIWENGERIRDAESVHVRIVDPTRAGLGVLWAGEATEYTDFSFAYWVIHPQLDPGAYQVHVSVTTTAGQTVEGVMSLIMGTRTSTVVSGMDAPRSETLTESDPANLYRITTDPSPNPAFYSLTVAEAVTNGRPSVILLGTPGLCSSSTCGPLMETTFEALLAAYGERVNIVHVESYDLQTSQYVAAMAEWGLNYEPFTYLVDAEGVVRARYDGPVALSEIQPLLDEMLNTGG